MQPKVFGYRSFIVKVMPHVLPSNILSTIAPLKYVASIAIIQPGEGRLSDHIRWIHPKGIYATPDEIFEFGSEYATQMIDDGFIEAAMQGSAMEKYDEDKTSVSGSEDMKGYSV